jgi:predicted transcriptional regulator
MKITHEKLKILNALVSGPKTHGMLRRVYYGEIRFKNPSNTSFYNQLQRMMDRTLIVKPAEGVYQITAFGREMVVLYARQPWTGLKGGTGVVAIKES